MGNMTGKMGDIARPMTCSINGNMVIFRDMDKIAGMTENTDDKIGMNGNLAIIESMDNMTGKGGKLDEMVRIDGKLDKPVGMAGEVGEISKKMVLIRNMDDKIQIVAITSDLGNTIEI